MRPILDIDIQDEKWKRFMESFKEYQDNTQKLNEVWKHFDVATNKPRAATEALDKAIGRARKSSEAMGKTWAEVTKHIGASEAKLARFERSIHGVERGLSRVARFGLKIGKFALAAGGIGFAGGLFGIDELANAAMQRQKAARGLGMPIGQVQAFTTYMQPYLSNPSGTLSAIINARRSPQGMAALAALGFNPAQYDNPNLNRMKFAEDVLERIRSVYLNARKNEPGVPIESILKAYMTQILGVGTEDARRMANTHQTQLQKSFSGMAAASRQLQIPGRTATDWAKLAVQLHAAGSEIETALINKLVKLAPLIGEMSKKVVSFIDSFMNSKEVGRIITDIKGDFLEFKDVLKSKTLREDLGDLGSAAMMAAKALLAIPAAYRWAENHTENAIGDMAKAWHDVEKTVGLGGSESHKKFNIHQYQKRHGLLPQAHIPGLYHNAKDWRKYNDPGNIDPIIDGVKMYRKYASMPAGDLAIANLLLHYGGAPTIKNLVTTYEGRNAKNLSAHISDISGWMHVGRNQKLDLKNIDVLAKLVAGIEKTENPRHRDFHELTNAIRNAIIDGMQSVRITAQSPAGMRIATATHVSRF
jgi:flavin-binding protein dodecin